MLMGYFSYAQYACPNISNPVDGDTDIAIDTEIAWNPVAGADGYFLSLGTSPGGTEILDQPAISANSCRPKWALQKII